ncbi:hypothetical protein M405DRAFT_862090 [Rhizopogon salebrosus TDB-379]|nr:hypothetical protein M405DRAFT_862090 [Rhizopogon salebrosus TDB-379]
MSSDQAKQGLDLNTFSVLRVAKGVISSMVQHKQGLIINIGSIAGNIRSAWSGLYCASRAAVHALSDVWPWNTSLWMYEMMHMSQEKGSMPADEFARRVVAKALSPNPPCYMSLWGKSRLAAFLQWLPRQLLI